MKQQYIVHHMDTETYHETTRNRVAYLLRAARSRGDVIHRVWIWKGVYNYHIGMMRLVQKQGYHAHVTSAGQLYPERG